MLKQYKRTLLLTSLLTLLPIPVGLLLWNRFPETMAIHWGITGQADGFASVPVTVLGIPIMMLGIYWLCVFFTALDKGNKRQNRKIVILMLWIIPVLSNLSCCGIYALALGVEFTPVAWTLIPMGLLFAAIGNYMPKTKMNATIGIKILWVYSSEENWRATHRFAGKIWLVGGLALLPAGFLPNGWAVTVMLTDIVILCVIPIIYSWRFYKRELAEGKISKASISPAGKKMPRIGAICLAALAVFLLFVLFYGDITFSFQEDHLLIESNMYTDHVVYYDTIESVEFRETNVPGLRVGGYGSFRLLMGWFENEEFGTYIRYTYYKPESCLVLRVKGSTVVLSGKTAEETRILYEQLQQHIS